MTVPRSRRLLSLALGALLAVPAVPAPGAFAASQAIEPAEAAAATPAPDTEEAYAAAAIAAFKASDYEGAVANFERAYDKSNNPNYLFNIGRVYEEAGQIERAIEYYEQFVKQPGVDIEERGVAVERLEVLRKVVAETTEQPAPEPVAPAADPTPAAPTEDPDAPRRRRLLIAGASLAGIGGAALIGGGVMGGLALADSNAITDETTVAAREDLASAGETKALTADILFAAGGVFAVTGIALIAVAVAGKRKAQSASRRTTLGPLLARDGAGLALHGRF
jgi:tetratricopeptide (TPR) repeat protein